MPLTLAPSADRSDEAPRALRRWERWLPAAIGAVAVVLSISLAAMLWFVQRSVERASALLVQGEALQLAGATQDLLRSLDRRPDDEDFRSLLAEQASRGLRYVALLSPDGQRIEAAAGEPATPLDRGAIDSLEPMDPVVSGERVRVLAGPPLRLQPPRPGAPRPPFLRDPPGRGSPPREPPPPPEPPHGGPFGAHAGPRADRALGPPGHAREFRGGPPGPLRHGPPKPPPRLVLEFEPVRAAELTLLAARTSGVGLLAVPAFLFGALLLVQLVRQREDLTRRLEHGRRLAALGEMTAVIAHEIRNPLASLKGHAQLLERSLETDSRRAKAELVVREAVRLQDLVSDLLEFSRSGTLELAPADPLLVLRESAEAVAPERIAIRAEGPRSWPLDSARMRQALGNVLRNAVQASPDGALVDAAVFCEGPALVYEVCDRGPGIPTGEEERIFEPFHTHKTRGTGLGLPLVRRIVRQHGGRVTAANRPEGGAVLRIVLPPAP